MQSDFYVYGLIDPYTNLPFYIGKGKGQRSHSHLKLCKNDRYNMRKRNHIEKLLNEDQSIKIHYYKINLSHTDAITEEITLIKHYGRKDIDSNGILLNLTLGGEGGDTSMFFTELSRKKISNANQGIKNPQSNLTEQAVINIYHISDTIENLCKTYNISKGQIIGIKRKIYYRDITDSIRSQPGQILGQKINRTLFTIDDIRNIYLEKGDFKYFLDNYLASRQVVKNIKLRKTFAKITENLGAPGELKINKLSKEDIIVIRQTNESNKKIAEQYNLNPETIRKIKKGLSRKLL